MEPLATPGVHSEPGFREHLRTLLSLGRQEISGLFSDAIGKWFEHNVPRLSASVAFYTLLSLAPLVLIVVAIAGMAFGREAAAGQLVWQIQDLIGREGVEIVSGLIRAADAAGASVIATIVGTLALMWGATVVVADLRDSLNTIWCVPKKETAGLQTLVSILVDRTVALGTVIGVGFLLLVSLTVSATLSAVGSRFGTALPIPEAALQFLDLFLSYCVISFLFAIVYKLLPDLYLEWRDVIPGGLFTGLLFSIGKVLIGMYLGKASVASAWGAAGSLVILLLWVYYSAQIFFLGAEFTQAYAQRFGSRPCDRIGKEVKIFSDGSAPETRTAAEDGRESLIQMP